jgi:hypothetical protein
MTEADVVSTARSPTGRAFEGSLVGVDAFERAKVAVGATIQRCGMGSALVRGIV